MLGTTHPTQRNVPENGHPLLHPCRNVENRMVTNQSACQVVGPSEGRSARCTVRSEHGRPAPFLVMTSDTNCTEVYPTTRICLPLRPLQVTARWAALAYTPFCGQSVSTCVSSIYSISTLFCRFWWPRGLRRGSAAVRLLGLRVRIPPGA